MTVSKHRIVSSCPQRAYTLCKKKWVTLGSDMNEGKILSDEVGELLYEICRKSNQRKAKE